MKMRENRWHLRHRFCLGTVFLGTMFCGAASADREISAWERDRVGLTAAQASAADEVYYGNAHPYLEEPWETLRKEIPELKRVQPAGDQRALPEILKKTATNVDDFFANFVDLIAREKIRQERMSGRGLVTGVEQVEDSYLILRHESEGRTEISEYRMDAKGNRLDLEQAGLEHGFMVTSGYAMHCNFFATAFQRESAFRYLGDEKLGGRDTYVVGFAAKPGKASLHVTMRGAGGTKMTMLEQGIAWVDKETFQIVRMRTDLLAPHPEIGMLQQTTEVSFEKVQLPDVGAPLWLPSVVKVYIKKKLERDGVLFEGSYRNEHHYTDYRHYGVSVKMKTVQ